MLARNIIEESWSPWKSPTVVVPKPDGAIRICINFCKVNSISFFDAFPKPNIEEMLEKIGQAKFISTLDLMKGYWQIPMVPEDKMKTTFGTPWDLYQFTQIPFGLHGAAASFQRLMDRILAAHQEYATAYIDDSGLLQNLEPRCRTCTERSKRTEMQWVNGQPP